MIVAAVQSALRQTLPPLEVLVCDNGSTDDSQQRIERIGDPRVRWISGPPGGRPAFPRNRGIAAARGEWLAFLDSDDEWLPGKLAHQLEVLHATGRRASSTNAIRFVPGVGRTGPYPSSEPVLDLSQFLVGNRVFCSSALIAKSLITETDGFPEDEKLRAAEDYALWLRVACFTEFDYLSEPHVVYRDDLHNSMTALGLERSRQRQEVLKDFLAWCRRHPSKQTRKGYRACRRRLRLDRVGAFTNPLWTRIRPILSAGKRRLWQVFTP